MRRVRLFDALDAGSEGRLVLISAPAGAGKAALLSTWLAERRRKRVGWMSLRPRRGESAFWAQFLDALRRVAPASTGLARLAAPRAGTPAGFVDRLLNAVAELRSPATLRHRQLPQPSSHRSRQRDRAALTGRDPKLRLIISTRHDPDLPVHVFRASGELVELRAADLAFTADETRAFLDALEVELPPPVFQVLLDQTKGGPQGCGCSPSRSARRPRDRSTPCSTTAPPWTTSCRRRFARSPRRHGVFCCKNSIVDRLTPELAEALTGMESAGMLGPRQPEPLHRARRLAVGVVSLSPSLRRASAHGARPGCARGGCRSFTPARRAGISTRGRTSTPSSTHSRPAISSLRRRASSSRGSTC